MEYFMVRPIKIFTILLLSLFCINSFAENNERVFKWAGSNEANSMDPYAIWEITTIGFQGNIYEPLVKRGKNLKLEPGLATKWSNPESLIWRFELRQNVTFHDGTPFTAADVVFSLNRAKGPGSDLKTRLESVAEVKIINDTTVDFIMNKPNPIFPEEISQWYIVSEKWCKANGAEWTANVRQAKENYATRNANGTGPFKLVKRVPDVRTELVAFQNWWGEKEHNIDRAIFTPIVSDSTRLAALISKDVDVIFPVSIQDVARVKQDKDLDVAEFPEIRTIFIGLNQWAEELPESDIKGKNPLKDQRVRKALYHAINIDSINKKIMRGSSVPTALMFGQGVNGYSEDLNKRFPFDIQKAKALLKEAGYPDGFTITFDLPIGRYVADEQIGHAVASMLAKIGVKVNVSAMPTAKYYPKIMSHNTSMYLLGWTSMSYDAYDPLVNVMHSVDKKRGLFNFGKYSNPEFDKLADKVAVELDETKRNQYISEACRIHKEDVGHIPLHQQKLAWGKKKSIEFVTRSDDVFCLYWVTMK
jgi:peptide/nickel transport system substrate-binding protein